MTELIMTRRAALFRGAMGSLVVVILTFVATIAPGEPQKKTEHLDVISEIPVAQHVRPRWCYDVSPEFVFIEGRMLFRGKLNGSVTKIAELDRPGDNASLVCSANGRTVFFLSAQHDRAYLFEDQAFAEYELSPRPPRTSVRYGSLMSPDGSTFAIGPANLVRGTDLLENKRLLNINTTDVFWSEKYVIHRTAGNSFVIRNISDLGMSKTVYFPPDILVDNIEECGSNTFIVVYSYRDRFAEEFSIENPNSRTLLSLTDSMAGSLNASNANCVLSIAIEDKGVYLVQRLLIVGNAPTRSIDVSPYKYTNDIFSISKDGKLLLSYQVPVAPRDASGRILSWEVGK